MPQPLRGRLDRDRVAQLRRGGDRLGRPGREPARHHHQPVRDQQPGRLRPGQLPAGRRAREHARRPARARRRRRGRPARARCRPAGAATPRTAPPPPARATARSGVGYDGTEPGRASSPPASASPQRRRHPLARRGRCSPPAPRGRRRPRPARGRSPPPASPAPAAKTATTASACSPAVAQRCGERRPRPRPAPRSTDADAISSPAATQASATSTLSAVELVTVATRRPAGSGWYASSWATSNSSVRVSTRITPDPSNSACTRSSGTGTVPAASTGVPRRTGRSSPRPPAWSGPPAGPAGRTCAGCRSSPGRAAPRRWPGRSPRTGAGRCR